MPAKKPLDDRVRLSTAAVTRWIGKGTHIAWNRFFPRAVLIDSGTASILNRAASGETPESKLQSMSRRQLLVNRLAFRGDRDPSEAEFVAHIGRAVDRARTSMNDFLERRQEYGALSINNNRCNLTCSYCVQRQAFRGRDTASGNPKPSREERLRRILSVVEQFLQRRIANGLGNASISFNGGEMLMDWPVLAGVVNHLAAVQPSLKIAYALNTNMTLMTPQIARFLAERGFDVHVSIDGYQEAHDKTRQYRNGRGSFQDVLRGVAMFNSSGPPRPITGFQGTLSGASSIETKRVRAMRCLGFTDARLSVNLLGTSPAEGVAGAKLLANLFEPQIRPGLQVIDGYFQKTTNVLRRKQDVFSFYCNGLCGVPTRGIQFNVSTMEVAQACPFFPAAYVSLEDVNDDIYHPRIAETAFAAFTARLKALEENCLGCEVVGICRGGCVMSGLDSANRVNPAACAFQREMWRRFARNLARKQLAVERRGREREERTPSSM